MASKKTLNAKNLEALGVERLAALLMEVSTGDVATKRLLRMELAAAQGPGDLAKEIRKRLITLARSRSFVDWSGIRALAEDLDTQRRAIVETLAPADPKEALGLLWRFMDLAEPTYERSDDDGYIGDVFREAMGALGDLAVKAKVDPKDLADRAFDALTGADYGQFDGLIPVLAPALGATGLDHLKQRMITLSETPVKRPADKDREKIGWSTSGPIYADETREHARISIVRLALKDIADA